MENESAQVQMPAESLLEQRIQEYLDAHWEEVVADIDALVRVPSFEDRSAAAEGAPYGPGPRAALSAALDLAKRMGFETHDDEGYVGYADFAGKTDTQLGIIGHMDVVPAGPGWHFEPFAVTRKDGYLVGRGVIDDKGPCVVALHAMNLWRALQQEGEAPRLPYTLRFIFGANEETGMGDVRYYRAHHADPAFLFTPDAEFPVCYGEKGIYNGLLTSANLPVETRSVILFEGGTAINAVPGHAQAVVWADAEKLPAAEGIAVEPVQPAEAARLLADAASRAGVQPAPGWAAADAHLARIVATGRSAHASLPESGVSAIGLLANYLLKNRLVEGQERAYFRVVADIAASTDGTAINLACADEHFGALTIVAGFAATKGNRFTQTIDVRYPTSITGDQLNGMLDALAQACGGSCAKTRDDVPFLVDPESPEIQALLSSYNLATGEDAKPFTMGGGTYAREFSRAASFGPEKPWVQAPAWAGSMHSPDEAVSEDLLKEAFRIYALTIGKLMQLDF